MDDDAYAASTTALIIDLPAHIPNWEQKSRRRAPVDVAATGSWQHTPGVQLRGGELSKDGCLFEGDRDALAFEPPLRLGRDYTVAVEFRPRKLSMSRNESRWMVATYGRKGDDDAAHVCLLAQEGKQTLGVWDGDDWRPCVPECDLGSRESRRGGFFRVVAHASGAGTKSGSTTFYVDDKRVGVAKAAVSALIVGGGNVPFPEGPVPSSSRKQVLGHLKRLEIYADALVAPAQCFPARLPKRPPFKAQPPRPKPQKRPPAAEPDERPAKKKKEKAAPKEAPPKPKGPSPATAAGAAALVRQSRVLRAHGEEEAFAAALKAAPRGPGLWQPYEATAPRDERAFNALLKARPQQGVFKFRARDLELDTEGQEIEAAAFERGGAAAMELLRTKSQMSQLFAPAGGGDASWENMDRRSKRVDFREFVASARAADAAFADGDRDALDACLQAGSEAHKVTEWKPDWLRQNPQLPQWFEQAGWLPRLASRHATVFRPKVALMQAGALTNQHRDNYGTLTWIKMLGGAQLLATWSCADGDATPGLGDDAGDASHSDAAFDWRAFSQLPSARLVLLEGGDFFLMQPGVYHRVHTLRPKAQLFGEFVGACTFPAALDSALKDRQRPGCLNACDASISMREILLAGCRKELGDAGGGWALEQAREALADFGALGGKSTVGAQDAALDALRWLPTESMNALTRLLGFDVDAACQLLREHKNL